MRNGSYLGAVFVSCTHDFQAEDSQTCPRPFFVFRVRLLLTNGNAALIIRSSDSQVSVPAIQLHLPANTDTPPCPFLLYSGNKAYGRSPALCAGDYRSAVCGTLRVKHFAYAWLRVFCSQAESTCTRMGMDRSWKKHELTNRNYRKIACGKH
jgi:hypothetical protein